MTVLPSTRRRAVTLLGAIGLLAGLPKEIHQACLNAVWPLLPPF
ncbi:hypothetical protein [Azospirillum formosense]|nr:hypothetical protein [Azospirillum formosense]